MHAELKAPLQNIIQQTPNAQQTTSRRLNACTDAHKSRIIQLATPSSHPNAREPKTNPNTHRIAFHKRKSTIQPTRTHMPTPRTIIGTQAPKTDY